MGTRQNNFFLSIVMLGMAYAVMPLAIANATDLLPPQKTIDQVSEQLKNKLVNKSSEVDFAEITEIVKEIIYPSVDFNRVSALVLGKHWKRASKAQKLRFKQEFQTLLTRTYARAFIEFNDWTVNFLPMTMKDDGKKALVKTEVIQPGRQPVSVDYRMHSGKGGWQVYDIIIEGVSLVTNYRNSFKNEVKSSGSLDAVIEKLAERNEKALTQPIEKNS